MSGTHMFVLPWELRHPGGVNEVVRNLLAGFERDGPLRPAVLTSDWSCPRPDVRVVDGRTTVHARLRIPCDEARPLKSFLLFCVTLPFALWRLGRALRRERVAVVNPHYPTLAAWNFVLARRLGFWRGRIVLSPHGDDMLHASRTRGWERLWWRGLYRAADVIVTPSNHLRDEVLRLDPSLEPRISVVYNGVDAPRLRAIAGSADAALPPELKGRRYVLNVGSFEPRKAQDVLLRAFRRVVDAVPDARLVLVGGAGPWSPRMAAMIAEAGLTGHVHRYESAPFTTVVALLRHAELLALPSRHETFGIALIEAGLFGVPAVATRVGGIPEVIEDGVNGRLIEPEDADVLSERIAELLRSPADRHRLGAAMRRSVDERFGWDRARESYARILDAA